MKASPFLLFAAMLAGCTHRTAKVPDDTQARAAVLAYLQIENAKIAGPLTEPKWPAEVSFRPLDTQAIQKHFQSGAIAYLVFAPDFHVVAHNSDGSPMEFIRVDRIVMLQGDRVIGEFIAL